MRRYASAKMRLGVALVVFASLVCGCSSNGSTSTNSAGAGRELGAKQRAIVDQLLTKTGTYGQPPSTSPPAKAGVNMWLISCGQAYTSCSIPIGQAAQASKTLGWKTTIFDDKNDPTNAGDGIRQAVADGARAIYLYYIDCTYVKSALEEARAAGVLIVASESAGCNDVDPNAKSGFDYVTTYSGGLEGPSTTGEQINFPQFTREFGEAQGLYAITKVRGPVKALVFTDTSGFSGLSSAKGMNEALGSCDGCSSRVVEFPYSELSDGSLQQRVAQELLNNPGINVVAASYDAIAVYGLAEGAATSGRDIVVIEGEGSEAGLDLLRAGKTTLGAGIPLGWEAYAAMDAANRLLQGQKPAPSGIGLQLFAKGVNVPEKGAYQPPVDYVSLYAKAWAKS
jgi:ribose transport system substrate-binding protein